MMLGHAVGLAAVQVVGSGRSVQDVDVKALRAQLLAEGAILDVSSAQQRMTEVVSERR
jgi:hypothetical protein